MGITRDDEWHFTAKVKEKARFVDVDACTGCQECERACTVAVPDQFNADLAARRAAYIPFPQAVPKKAVLERAGTSPCIGACPAGSRRTATSRSCAAARTRRPSSSSSTPPRSSAPSAAPATRRASPSAPAPSSRASVPIRLIKRYAADQHYAAHGETPTGPAIEVDSPNGHKVAIVGSGPAGLTAAWQLARKGYAVKIFEKRSAPGGYLRHAIPVYRLPHEVVDADIANLTSIGVEIECDAAIDRPRRPQGERLRRRRRRDRAPRTPPA